MAYTDKQKLIETNVNYTSKDFSTIKADLIEYTKAYFPDTYKDFNETSPGMMLIELSSYVGDVLSYYIDYNYKENLLATATEKRNIRRLKIDITIINYSMKKIRQYRSRQGRSDRQVENNYKILVWSVIGLVITFLVSLLFPWA